MAGTEVGNRISQNNAPALADGSRRHTFSRFQNKTDDRLFQIEKLNNTNKHSAYIIHKHCDRTPVKR